ncbi:MAG: hypothetical protein LBF67_07795 [Prevotellaceae bacterium]|jgi:hypothetical protein|nr:hypothetical protein [Prevotellaceae bacterium]
MMTKNKTSKLFTLKALAIAPVVALLVALLGCERRPSRSAQRAEAVASLPASNSGDKLLPDSVAITLKTGKVITLIDTTENFIARQIATLKISPDSIQSIEVFKNRDGKQNARTANGKSFGDSVVIHYP